MISKENNTMKSSKSYTILIAIFLLALLTLSSACKQDVTGPGNPPPPPPPPPPPTTPTGVYASKSYSGSIILSWNKVDGASGYKVYQYASNSNQYIKVATVTTTSWTDRLIDAAKWYYYKVAAYSNSGESQMSDQTSGYGIGWRFDKLSIQNTSSGIGLNYDLYAFGYRNIGRIAAIYAIYQSGSSYYYVPGYGAFNTVAATYTYVPQYSETIWGQSWTLPDNMWNGSYKNNNYKQYIQLRIYKSATITSLNNDSYNETGLFQISWSGVEGNMQPTIIRKLSPAETAEINHQLKESSTSVGNASITSSVNPEKTQPIITSESASLER
jgi:hypothetical protein